MKSFFALLTAAGMANAHFTMQYLFVNGVDQGKNVGIRIPPNNSPVEDVTSPNMRCNVNGATGVARTIDVPSGATIQFEWHEHDARVGPGSPSLSAGHDGPVQVYIAKAPSTAQAFDGSGNVWTKLASSGLLNPSTQEWATDIVTMNGGLHSVKLPSSLPAGEYLLRAEILALHAAGSYPGAQFYIGCAQIKIASGGSASPPTVAFPGAYAGSHPGISINIHWPLPQTYTAPGPAVWSA